MGIPLQAQVECTDGVCGQSAYVLINPESEQVTHVVVKGAPSPQTEYVVPVDIVSPTVTDTTKICCSRAELEKLEPFVQTWFVAEQLPDSDGNLGRGIGPGYYWPYVSPDVTVYRAGEMAVRRRTLQRASQRWSATALGPLPIVVTACRSKRPCIACGDSAARGAGRPSIP